MDFDPSVDYPLGGTPKVGDPVRVRVGQIDAPRGRVDLLPAWEEA